MGEHMGVSQTGCGEGKSESASESEKGEGRRVRVMRKCVGITASLHLFRRESWSYDMNKCNEDYDRLSSLGVWAVEGKDGRRGRGREGSVLGSEDLRGDDCE